jgi:protein phosphatase 1L
MAHLRVSYDFAAHQGERAYQEDRISIHPNIVQGIHYFAVFDGHGRKHGANISALLEQKMAGRVKSAILSETSSSSSSSSRQHVDLEKVLKISFHSMAEFVSENAEALHARHNGSTATVLLMDMRQRAMWVAYCGDSLCLCAVPAQKRIGFLTPAMHKVETESERERMLLQGANLNFLKGTWRVASDNYQVNLSRGFGDLSLAPAMTFVPDVLQYQMPDTYFYVVLATDGLWDVVNHDMMQAMMLGPLGRMHLDAQTLSDLSKKLGTADNTSVIVLNVSSSV